MSGVAANDESGRSVASAGDVNGDGYDDLILGAPYADPNGTESGAAYVVFGGAFGATVTTTGTTAAEMLIGGSGDDLLTGGGGADVFHAGAGDDRLVVSDLTFQLADGGTGTDTLALDGSGLVLDLTTALAADKLEGIERIDLTGTGNNTLKIDQAAVLGGVGDVTGGKHILTVEGNVGDKVLFGDEPWQNTGTFTDASGTFDRWVLGDAQVNVEQGVSVPSSNIDLSSLDGTNGFTLNGVTGSSSGWSVASAGDVNGDGFADVIVGGGFVAGSYVVFGHAPGFAATFDLATLDGTNGFKLSDEVLGDFSGKSVASAGDVNGDGFDDIIVGAIFADPHGTDSGASYVVFGKAAGFAANIQLSSLDGSNGFKLSGAAPRDRSGYSVASAGDVNGDGYDDVIIGAPAADPNGSYSGTSYVVFGKAGGFAANLDLSSLNGTNGFRLNGSDGDLSGRSVASAGDVNGDGFGDLIVGAYAAQPNGQNSGETYVVFGKAGVFAADMDLSSLDGTTGFKLIGGAEFDQSGRSVASAGDVNGDGFADLIVGANYADPNGMDSGASYVVFGHASTFAPTLDLSTLDGINGFRVSGAAAYDSSGFSVASAGDFNGDGFDDLIIGAAYAHPNGEGSGASYVVFGKASGFGANINLSALDGSNGFRLPGVAAYDGNGRTVASAGDVNGDGYDDLIVGARGVDTNGANSGASYIVFGGAFGESTAPVTLTGTSAGEVFIGGRGDDVLTGGGGADVFHGGAGDDTLVVSDLAFQLADGGGGTDTLKLDGTGLVLDLTTALAAAKLEGIERIDLTGTGNNTLKIDQAAVLGGVGDVTGGKHILTVEGNVGDKVLFGDEPWQNTGTFTDASGTFDRWVLGDAQVNVERGVSVPIPNINLSSLDGTNGFKLNGVATDDRSGQSVASAGDVNGDGFDDLIIGAIYAEAPGYRSGASYVVFGKASGFDANVNLSTLDGNTGFRLSGGAPFDLSGMSVASAGDVNGDGFGDLIVGAMNADPHGNNSGASYVVFGHSSGFAADVDFSTLDGTSGFKLSGVSTSDRSGISVASAGDFNGDGYDDLIVGASGADGDAGAAYVVFGKASGFAANLDLSTLDGTIGFKLSGAAAGDGSGRSVASAGDVNGDGYDDLIVGAGQADPNGASSGTSYVVFGRASGFAANLDLSSLDGNNGFSLHGVAEYDTSGYSVASAGDINGDGFADLIIGASSADPNGFSSGASYVVFGKASGFGAHVELSSLNGTNGFRLDGAGMGSYSGGYVASAGDFNGDGYDDLIVTAVGPDNFAGATYVVFGKASGFAANLNLGSLDGSNGFKLSGAAPHDQSGTSAASTGDVNGDGFDDLIVGAWASDPNGSLSGASYVVFGGAFGATVTTTGTAAAEMLIGGSSDDVLTGGGGADVFHAGAGDDRLIVSDLSFRLADGGNGTDTLVLADAGLSLNLVDPLVAAKLEGIERIDLTGTGNDVRISQIAVLGGIGEVVGGKHILTVLGDGNDTVLLGAEPWIKTGTFTDASGTFDRWVFGNAEVRIEQGIAVPGITLNGTAGDNVLTGTSRADFLNGLNGNDTLVGGLGADTMTGGAGNDIYYVDDAGDVVTELTVGGSDTIYTSIDYTLTNGAEIEVLRALGATGLTLTANDAGIALFGSDGNDTLIGGAGNDRLGGGLGNNVMIGGDGNDLYYVDNAGDTVTEGAGAMSGIDTVRASVSYTLSDNVERLILFGTANIDGFGNALANVMTGNDGNNVLDGGAGTDVMTGGAGDDTYYVDQVADKVFESIAGGTDTVYTGVSYVLRAGQEIENLAINPDVAYAALALNLTGNEFANTLTGNDAANKLDGKGGADTMIGGDGNDIYFVDDAGDQIVETAGHGTDTVYTTASHTLSANVEALRGQGTADITLTGNDDANLIVGNAGANRIDGGAGADQMIGADGNDTYVVDNLGDTISERDGGGADSVEASVSFTLGAYVETLTLTGAAAIDGTGSKFANTITGNGAANTIDGKGGFDTLTGNGGADTFVFSSKLDAGLNFATITDFQHGVDHIALDLNVFRKSGAAGTLEDQFFTASAPTTNDQHIIYDAATGVLSFDIDGVGTKAAPIAFAQVTPGTVLDHNDFLIV